MPVTPRRTILDLAAAAILPTPHPGAVQQQQAQPAADCACSSRTVRNVVHFPPGQASDTSARLMAEKRAARSPQPIVADNRPGIGDALEVEHVARAAPDGYALLWSGTGMTALPAVASQPPPYRAQRDLEAVARFADIPLTADSSAGALPQVRAGRAVALAVAAEQPWPLIPEVPTAAEAGVAAMGWNSIFAPIRAPPAVVQRVHADSKAVLIDLAVQARFTGPATEAMPGGQEAFHTSIAEELAKWRAVARAAQVKLE